MVEAARIAYRDFPTVVNEVPESGITYDNTMAEYARMDSNMQSAQKAIGGSSDTAQLSQSYYWSNIVNNGNDNDTKQYYENTVILAVCAQLAIDGCKKVFAVDVNDDILRIRNQPCMKREKDYPKFIQWTHDIPITKNNKERPYEDIKRDKNKIRRRVDPEIICPMNWLEDCLDKIQGVEKSNRIETYRFMCEKPVGKAKATQMSKIRKIVEDYSTFVQLNIPYYYETGDILPIQMKTEETIEKIKNIKMSMATIYRLIETSLGIEKSTNTDKIYLQATKYTRKMMNLLYRTNKEKFLNCFVKNGFASSL